MFKRWKKKIKEEGYQEGYKYGFVKGRDCGLEEGNRSGFYKGVTSAEQGGVHISNQGLTIFNGSSSVLSNNTKGFEYQQPLLTHET